MDRIASALAVLFVAACGSAGPPTAASTDTADDERGHGMHGSAMGGHGMHGSAMGGHGMHGSAMGGHGMHGSAMGGHGMHGSAMGGHGMRRPPEELRDDFHALLDQHERIERQVERTVDGVVTTTTSDDPAIAETLRRHVRGMDAHLASGGRVHGWDPLFAALADQAEAIELTVEAIPGGVRVTSHGTTPEAVALIHAHADVVSAFVANGHEEAHREHPVP